MPNLRNQFEFPFKCYSRRFDFLFGISVLGHDDKTSNCLSSAKGTIENSPAL